MSRRTHWSGTRRLAVSEKNDFGYDPYESINPVPRATNINPHGVCPFGWAMINAVANDRDVIFASSQPFDSFLAKLGYSKRPQLFAECAQLCREIIKTRKPWLHQHGNYCDDRTWWTRLKCGLCFHDMRYYGGVWHVMFNRGCLVCITCGYRGSASCGEISYEVSNAIKLIRGIY